MLIAIILRSCAVYLSRRTIQKCLQWYAVFLFRTSYLQDHICCVSRTRFPAGLLQCRTALEAAAVAPRREAWVLEPEQPTPADTWRRVAVGGHASLLVRLDPARPRGRPPELRFMGSEAGIAPLRARLHAADAPPWDASRSEAATVSRKCCRRRIASPGEQDGRGRHRSHSAQQLQGLPKRSSKQ